MEKGGGRGLSPHTAHRTPKTSAVKSTASKTASMKGKDDSSAKTKRSKRVQIDSEDSSDDELDFAPKSGNLSKGGKGGNREKVAKGGKTPVVKETARHELKILSELPKNAKCLMDCEAAQMLHAIQEQMVLLSRDPTIKIPASFDKGLQFAKTCARYTNPHSVRRVLDALTSHGVSDDEICLIANLCPETADEVFALVPSLKSKELMLRGRLMDALSELGKLKQSV